MPRVDYPIVKLWRSWNVLLLLLLLFAILYKRDVRLKNKKVKVFRYQNSGVECEYKKYGIIVKMEVRCIWSKWKKLWICSSTKRSLKTTSSSCLQITFLSFPLAPYALCLLLLPPPIYCPSLPHAVSFLNFSHLSLSLHLPCLLSPLPLSLSLPLSHSVSLTFFASWISSTILQNSNWLTVFRYSPLHQNDPFFWSSWIPLFLKRKKIKLKIKKNLMENNSGIMKRDDLMELPPGFRFHPTDEELITHYLCRKVIDSSFSAIAIGEVDMNKVEPWELPCEFSHFFF